MVSGIVFLLGLCVGSFLNVLADRLPRDESILGRSHCDQCKKTLRWFELVPVFSFLVQRGRCLRCGKSLSIQYPLVELATAFGFVFLFPHYLLMVLYSSLLVIFISDLTYQIIPDLMVVVGVIAAAFVGGHWAVGVWSSLFLFALWAITRGRGMGFGDVKYAFLMGLYLGYPRVVVAYYVAFLTGAVVGVILMLGRKKAWKSTIAFGPFLVLGTIVASPSLNFLSLLPSSVFLFP